jgi:hypothetical protein
MNATTAKPFTATIPEIWGQKRMPVVYRPDEKGNLMLRLPYREGNRAFLQGEKRFKPVWNPEKKYWEVPKSWFTELVESVTAAFGSTYVIQPHHDHERCNASCQNAKRLECECPCLGKNHGMGGRANHEIGIQDAVVVPWRDHHLTIQVFQKRAQQEMQASAG